MINDAWLCFRILCCTSVVAHYTHKVCSLPPAATLPKLWTYMLNLRDVLLLVVLLRVFEGDRGNCFVGVAQAEKVR